MSDKGEWKIWSKEKLANEIPSLLEEVLVNLDNFDEEKVRQNKPHIQALQEEFPTTDELNEGTRSHELIALGFSIDHLARIAYKNNQFQKSLRLFQAAFEVFRCDDPAKRTKEMRQTLLSAMNIIVSQQIELTKTNEIDANTALDRVRSFVSMAWGHIPPQLDLSINEMVLLETEKVRSENEDDTAFYERYIRDNVETVLTLEIPRRLENIQQQWKEAGEHIAPAAVRMAQSTLRRARKLSELLPEEAWTSIEQATAQGDITLLCEALLRGEEELETNLKLRLDAKIEFLEPQMELRFRRQPDRFFVEARKLILKKDPLALKKFRDIHFHKSNYSAAKEWYAYALSLFGRATDIFEIIELLEDTIDSRFYDPNLGWTARWNLACALRRLPARADEALDVLLPVLKLDFHTTEVFELCLLWALEQARDDILSDLLLKSPYFEAYLLAALLDLKKYDPSTKERNVYFEHFKRIGRILPDKDYVFPEPKERLHEALLDDLTRNFIENSLIPAGVEWFSQRLTYGNERHFYKNWECAAILNEKADRNAVAWTCYKMQWQRTKIAKINKKTKTDALRKLLSWAQRNDFLEDAIRILRRDWRQTTLTQDDLNFLESRHKKTTMSSKKQLKDYAEKSTILNTEFSTLSDEESASSKLPELSSDETEKIIQQTATIFTKTGTADILAEQSNEANQLLNAMASKHSDIPFSGILAIREIVRLASVYHQGIDQKGAQELALEMKEHLKKMNDANLAKYYEISELIRACERVVQSLTVRAKAIPDLRITPPSDLKLNFGIPEQSTDLHTTIITRLVNPAPEPAKDICVAFTSTSSNIMFQEKEINLTEISSDQNKIISCPVTLTHTDDEEIEVTIHTAYSIGGITKTIQSTNRIKLGMNYPPIPAAQRYITGRPVDIERTDLFHGRTREIQELKRVFEGGSLQKLYFVNGIRRVGKSSLMQHLGANLGPEVLPILLNVETALAKAKMTLSEFVRQLIREALRQTNRIKDVPKLNIEIPSKEVFDLEPPWNVFEEFLENLKTHLQVRNILLCFDEVQHLVGRIADSNDPMDDGFLSWIRSQTQMASENLVICTGSEPYELMRKRYEKHTVWGNMEPYNISFVDKAAMKDIATKPVEEDKVIWLPESIGTLWDMTEGHPWLTQLLSEKTIDRLSKEKRRVVAPGDIEWAATELAADSRISELWWNEQSGLITQAHRDIAFLILQNQPSSRSGILEPDIAQICGRAGIRSIGKHLEEMRNLEVLSNLTDADGQRWRIRGAFLERHLATLMQRAIRDTGPKSKSVLPNQPLALMVDWENIKIRLSEFLKQQPQSEISHLKKQLEVDTLGRKLLECASCYGAPRQKWTVANWEAQFFSADQKTLRRVGFHTDISGEDKADASDHVLREKIHYVLREHPDINVFIIGTGDGDFVEVIKTLLEQGKYVVLWATREGISSSYKYYISGPDAIQIEWLEDLVFESTFDTK